MPSCVLSFLKNEKGTGRREGNCGFLDFWMKIMEEWVLVCMASMGRGKVMRAKRGVVFGFWGSTGQLVQIFML